MKGSFDNLHLQDILRGRLGHVMESFIVYDIRRLFIRAKDILKFPSYNIF